MFQEKFSFRPKFLVLLKWTLNLISVAIFTFYLIYVNSSTNFNRKQHKNIFKKFINFIESKAWHKIEFDQCTNSTIE